jgi:hypothetical protein
MFRAVQRRRRRRWRPSNPEYEGADHGIELVVGERQARQSGKSHVTDAAYGFSKGWRAALEQADVFPGTGHTAVLGDHPP